MTSDPKDRGDAAPSPALAPPPGNPRFPLFDGMRGIALLAVLSFHSAEYTGRLGLGLIGRVIEVAGPEAVIVFFVISGFLLYTPFAAARAAGRASPSLRLYTRRRAMRILPAYWITLTLLAIFPGLVGVFTGEWWRYYGFLQVYSAHARGGGIQVAWTLCTDLTFYVLLPLWAGLMRRIPGAGTLRGFVRSELSVIGLVVFGAAVVQLAVSRKDLPYALSVSLPGQAAWIGIGMGLAVASVAVKRDPRVLAPLRWLADRTLVCWALGLLAAAGLVALVPNHGLFGLIAAVDLPQSIPQTVAKLGLEGALVIVFVLPAVFADPQHGLARRVLGWRPFVYLGVISYSFYLYHLPIVTLLAIKHTSAFSATGLNLLAHIHTARTLTLYVLALAITSIVATISYRFVELPFLRRKERDNQAIGAAAPPPASAAVPEEQPRPAVRMIDAS